MKSHHFKVLAIDPGPQYSAIVAWDGQQILINKYLENSAALDLIESMAINDFSHLAIEKLILYQCCDSNVHDTIFFYGRATERWRSVFQRSGKNCYLYLIPRQSYFSALIQTNKIKGSKDSVIRKYLIDRFGHPGTKLKPNKEAITYGLDVYVPNTSPKAKKGAEKRKDDCWQAFALAVYTYDELTAGRLTP